jgi:branched-chain amino acid transport system permease protein
MKLLNKFKYPGVMLILVIVLGISPMFTSSNYYAPQMSSIMMFMVIALSWTIFSTPTGYISLASAAFYGVGIYTSAFLGEYLPLPVTMVLGGIISFGLAFLIGAITLRLRGVYFTIFTFGLVELLKNVVLWFEIKYSHTRGRFVATVDPLVVFYCILGTLLLVMIAAYIIKRSRFGLALVSIGECEDAATHIGINATMVKILAFAISSFAIGAVGAAMATRWNYIDPQIAFDATMSFMPVLMAIFGGMSNMAGPLIGAAVFAYLEETLITTPGAIGKSYMLIFGAVMVIAILFLPNGLTGLVQKLKKHKKGAEGKHADIAS